MKQLFAGAVVAAMVVAPACAQRAGSAPGGGGGGFHGGGGASHGGAAALGGPAAPHGGAAALGGPAALHGGPAAPGGFSRPVSVSGRPHDPRYGDGGGSGMTNPRPSFHHGGWKSRGAYAVPYGYGVVVGYPGYAWQSEGWVDANGPGYDSGNDSGSDPGSGDNGGYDVGPYPDEAGLAPEGYGPQMAGGEEAPMPYGTEGPNVGSGYESRAAELSPGAQPLPVAAPSAAAARAPVYEDEAVTLIFKDGRAPEKIYNFALTRTTLYVTDAKRREIPVAALDLAATEKANRAAGVRFQLPGAQ